MSLRLKKQRTLVVALVRHHLARVDQLARLAPDSLLMLEHAVAAVEGWRVQLHQTLCACFEDNRIADDITRQLASRLRDVMAPGQPRVNPRASYKGIYAKAMGVRSRGEKILQGISVYPEMPNLPPMTSDESALVVADTIREFNVASRRPVPSPATPPAPRQGKEARDRVEAAVATRKVFISHSAKDAALAGIFVDLLTAAFEPPLARGDIMCTSVPGCTLEGGARTDERLLAEIKSTPVFVGLVTAPSASSSYVLFELGARWAVGGKLTVPLLGPGCGPELLPGPWKLLNAHRTDKRDRVQQLVFEVSQVLERQLRPPSEWDHRVTSLTEIRQAVESEAQSAMVVRAPRLVAGTTVLEGADLNRLEEDASAYREVLTAVGQHRDIRIVDAALRVGDLDLALLRDHEAVKEQVQKIFTMGQRIYPGLDLRLARIERDVEHDCDRLSFTTGIEDGTQETHLDFEFLSGAEWAELAALYGALAELGPGPYRLETVSGDALVGDVFEAVDQLKNARSAVRA